MVAFRGSGPGHSVEPTSKTRSVACLLFCLRTQFGRVTPNPSTVCIRKSRLKGVRTVQVRFDDFISEVAMLNWIAAQSADLELAAAGLQCTQNSASLLPRCADYGDQFLIVG